MKVNRHFFFFDLGFPSAYKAHSAVKNSLSFPSEWNFDSNIN